MNKEKVKAKILHSYFICWECATALGGVMWPGKANTVSQGECPYCFTQDITIIPYVDFQWPDPKVMLELDKKKKKIMKWKKEMKDVVNE